jgi:hypothetical protein
MRAGSADVKISIPKPAAAPWRETMADVTSDENTTCCGDTDQTDVSLVVTATATSLPGLSESEICTWIVPYASELLQVAPMVGHTPIRGLVIAA